MSLEELFKAFKAEAYDAGVDPDDDYYWDSLAFGFAIAKGCSREQAFHLSLKWFDYCTLDITIEEVVESFDPNIFDDE